MRVIATIAAAVALLAGTAVATAAEPAARAAAAREGTVVSVDRNARTFRLRDSERGTVRIKVTRSTRFHRIAGFNGLRRGMTGVEATIHRSGGAWVATLVERSGGGGRHGGGHGGGRDD